MLWGLSCRRGWRSAEFSEAVLEFSKLKIRFLKLLCAFGSCFAFALAKTEGATRFLGLLPILLTNLLLKINLFY